ncbi:MAG: 50S ribosomal protein L24 [Candidatus Beckwithbacteria bacterium GW2011_GWB1_47_15]|uniref:Large ribosomal subunit protein uL24 n=1 Tax=Candidatus Beckwithbacteria bacterium GW2011_GWB1_47_15 TaxID=1618371 RepID=A0A0G1UW15_9BACT|nr:MAG: 50S ribosomal protein L24, large subunit ribosomal protein L24 [Candidatus Beckwithbacteria bacterium GW2011_GWC1_49_16]AQS30754.1 hypothetical protein [uncultured bacterium]KKU35941.1 MAG: 50S ribosomal protein L24 [Candidatus Beckwithbacteria bacterium GW2011_GWA1_46_30]KKU61905.1 MAG: 50S ribosomal protein L24 [Candidatus Beckwithbacteria bacterium GW2011_GWB1_47_15]KKU72541.1 MAG: 50S ribosomal protein L24 [Candidatus Beckwithbacteria bacterium GW2011_GWA2_47_25]KKW04292.1 MAG: 50S
MKLKPADTVKVVLGRDRGRSGKVEAVLPRINSVIVAGVNQVKKHQKAQGQNRPGGIVDISKPLNVAKVKLICPQCHQPTRVGFQGEGKKKVRVCKKCGKPVDSKTK